MKKLLLMVASVLTVFTASAQYRGHGHGHFEGGGFYRPHPRVYVGVGAPYWGWGPGYYGWGYPYYSWSVYHRPSKLDMQIADIKHDYADRISSVKMDEGLDRREKREKIHELKIQRDDAIYDAKANYYKRSN
ncbi:hypothetical protein ACTHGU_04215 [Chitinophagaceae bacterium MMS25-I14]